MSTLDTNPATTDSAELPDLLRSFNAVAEQLSATHERLSGQVTALQQELATTRAQLRRSRQLAALGEMAAGIAHEIRNPLGCIALDAQALSEDLQRQPALSKLAGRVLKSVERLDEIVRDVLAFARDARLSPCDVTVAEVIDCALESCQALLERGRIRLERDRDAERSRRIVADRGLLTQAVSNVLRNAVEALLEAHTRAPVIRIEVGDARRLRSDGRRERMLVLAFEDNGPGIPPEARRRMFNPFFTTRAAGTGLGLAIVHRIVDAHGGRVGVSDASLGGARFELCLPPRPRSARDGQSVDDASVEAAVRRRVNGSFQTSEMLA